MNLQFLILVNYIIKGQKLIENIKKEGPKIVRNNSNLEILDLDSRIIVIKMNNNQDLYLKFLHNFF